MTARRRASNVPASAVLVDGHEVFIRDVSRTGCLLEGRVPMTVGVIGLLIVGIRDNRHISLFRVCRTRVIDRGTRVHESGVEFLPLIRGGPSIRDAILDGLE